MEPIEFVFASVKKGANTAFAVAIDTGIAMPVVIECLNKLTEEGAIRRVQSGTSRTTKC